MSAAHPIPLEALRESIAIVGRTGSGKSYAAKGAVELLLARSERVCILDPTGVWHGLRSSADGTAPGFAIVVFGGDHADFPIADTSGHALAELVATNNLPAIVDVSEFTIGGRTRFATAFLEELYRHNKGPLTLVVDEADIFAPQRAMPDQTVMLSRMEQICRRGRVRGFRPWLITQRPAELHKSVLSQANTLIAMQLTAPQDRDAIGAWIEGQADRDEGKKVLAALPRLKRGEGYVWSPSHDVLARSTFPRITTFDSGRTPEEGEALPQLTLATVDVAGIAERLKAVEAETAKDDPKALRARIADLERNGSANPGALDLAKRNGYEEARQEFVAWERESMLNTASMLREVRNKIDLAIRDAESAAAQSGAPQNADSRLPHIAATEAVAPAAVVKRPVQVRHSDQFDEKTGSRAAGSNGALPRAERLILAALAQYPQGRNKVQVAILTGYAVGGGGFSNAVSALRTKGYLDGDAARLVITRSGVAALGDFTPLPRGRALLAHWLEQLSKAERKALETLAEVYPRTLSKAQLANRAGYEANGGGFNNALSRLRTLELIAGRAELRASETLFD